MDSIGSGIAMAIAGGALLGLAAGLLTILTGRVMSGSGMIGSLLGGPEGIAATSIAFIGGIVVAPVFLTGLGFASTPLVDADWPLLVAGGLLAGVGAGLGAPGLGGAMSGISRRSLASCVSLLVSLAGAAAAVLLLGAFEGGGGA